MPDIQDTIIEKMDRLRPGEKFMYHKGATGDLEMNHDLQKIRKATALMRELKTHFFFQRRTGNKFKISGRETNLNEYEYYVVSK